ncbi:prolyl-tRNA synthetase associated domain-containing protein [bacterium]|nr:prolyl-tRNA synthetase associated domain-containing protein [bacterium]
MSMSQEQHLYDYLEKLDVSYERHEHPPVYTVEESQKYWAAIRGAHCKNLFLRDQKGKRHYLVILKHSKRLDLKSLQTRLNEGKLSFASENRLQKYLGLSTGAVSPFGLINDHERNVQVVLDKDLEKEKLINFHPNVNTATITISSAGFMRFLASCGNRIHTLEI